jgi:hypothetical protein
MTTIRGSRDVCFHAGEVLCFARSHSIFRRLTMRRSFSSTLLLAFIGLDAHGQSIVYPATGANAPEQQAKDQAECNA